MLVTIILNSLNYIVKINNNNLLPMMKELCSRLTSFTYDYNKQLSRFIKREDKYYYVYDNIRNEYRFPITTMKYFIYFLKSNRIGKDKIEIITNKQKEYEKIEYETNKDFKLRDYQQEAVKLYVENLNKKIMLLDLPTGAGKTSCSCFIISRLQFRVACILLPKYVKKWVDDFKLYLNIEKEEICVIQGEDTLVKLMQDPSPNYKAYIFSIPTLTSYFKSYESGENYFPIKPYDLMDHIKTNVLFNDETHQHFHAITKCICYFNTACMICSSATLESNRNEINKIYKKVVPYDNRISNLVKFDPYVDTMVVEYSLIFKRRQFKYKTNRGYNHILFEESILKIPRVTDAYFDMIDHYFKQYYYTKRQPEDRVAIFFASVNMCNEFTEYLLGKYPDENIYRYIGGDDYETMMQSSIIVTNHGMTGTGIDIKNLTTVIQTVSASSLQYNLQNFGRLRRLENKDTNYIYLYTPDIRSQRHMHSDRYDAIASRSKKVYFLNYFKPIVV